VVNLLVLSLELFALRGLHECLIDKHQQLPQLLAFVQLCELVVLVQVKRAQLCHLPLQQKVQLRPDTRVRVNVHLPHQLKQVLHREH
jgi:hypothetical protein